MNYQIFASKTYLFDLKLNYQNKNLDRGFAIILPRVSKLPIFLFCISLLRSETEVLICISHLMLAIKKGIHICCFLVLHLLKVPWWVKSTRDFAINKNLEF